MSKDESFELEKFSAHPWIRRKAELASILIGRFGPKKTGARILEIGCGPGHNLVRLREACPSSRLTGLDLSPHAVRLCRSKGIKAVKADFMRYSPSEKFDLVLMMDFLEHMEHDEEALKKAGAMLEKGGLLICSVPANPELFGSHDRRLGHYRRYRLEGLIDLAKSSGFDVICATHWNAIAALPAIVTRQMLTTRPDEPSELKRSSGRMSVPLDMALGLENLLAGAGMRLPFGLSAVAVLKKK